jgi:hypothetical protein
MKNKGQKCLKDLEICDITVKMAPGAEAVEADEISDRGCEQLPSVRVEFKVTADEDRLGPSLDCLKTERDLRLRLRRLLATPESAPPICLPVQAAPLPPKTHSVSASQPSRARARRRSDISVPKRLVAPCPFM